MKSITVKRKIFIFGIPLLLVFISFLILKSNTYKLNPNLMSFGVTFDLLVSIPLIYYFLIRNTNISKTSLSIIITLNLLIASLLLPKQNQFYLTVFKNWILPFIELIFIGILMFKVKKTLRAIKKEEHQNADFFTILKQVIHTIVPKKVATLLATEIAVFYYGFIYWKKPKLKKNEFSYHKNSGIITVLIAFMISGIIEIFVIHKLLLKWNKSVAFILTFFSIYTIIQLFGILRALPKRPITIKSNGLDLKYGIIAATFIEFTNIQSIEIYTKDAEDEENIHYFSPFRKLEGYNVKIVLKEEQFMEGFYGVKKKIKNLVLFIDDKNEFINQTKLALQKHNL